MYQLTLRTEAMGITEQGTAARLAALLKKYSLPLTADAPRQELLQVMGRDKKKQGSSITLVILEKIGSGKLQKIDWQQLPEYLG